MTDIKFPKVLPYEVRQNYGDMFKKDCIFTDPEAIISLGQAGHLSDKKLTYLEPACGTGNLSIQLEKRGYNITSADRLDWGYGKYLSIQEQPSEGYDIIVTNPPYSIWEEFLEQCLRVARKDIYLLLPLRYLEGQKRSVVLEQTGLTTVLIFAYRVKMYNSDGHKLSGMTAYAFFHWHIGNEEKPILGWLHR